MFKTKFLKRIISIFLIITLIYANLNMTILGVISYAASTGNTTLDSQKGNMVLITQLLNNNYLYCLNHGIDFYSGYYYCYSVGETSPVLAYLVYKQNEIKPEGKRDQETDPIANAVWYLVGSNTEAGVDYQTYLNEAIENTKITQKDGNITLTGPAETYEVIDGENKRVILEDEEGKFGPFKITYPTKSNGEVLGKLQILINGVPLATTPKSGEEFYLTEEDNLNLSGDNTIQVIYNGVIYTAYAAYYTPPQYLIKYSICECGGVITEGAYGYVANGNLIEDPDALTWTKISETHTTDECQGKITESKIYSADKTYQDLIYIEPSKEEFEEKEELTFYAKERTVEVSGQVWLDGQTGLKPVKEPNGKKDSGESGIAGVKVEIKRTDGTETEIEPVVTDSNGNYKFEKVPRNKEYYIEFTYDGIKYIATVAGGDSDASEVDRQAFNDKFHTIEKNVAIGTDGSTTPLTYNANGELQKTTASGENSDEFTMVARTESILLDEDTEGIDLGLVEKSVDLAATIVLNSATVNINGKTQTYDYADIKQLEKDADGNYIIKNGEEKTTYNLYLYNSDYNYRIKDYDLPEATQKDYLTVNQNTEYGSALSEKRKADGDLSATVTYQVAVSNQSATEASVNELAFYYDTKYEPVGGSEIVTINGTQYYKYIAPCSGCEFNDSINSRQTTLPLTVGKDSNGNLNKGKFECWVEITSYSTNNSCIDCDSVPDNIQENPNEDDTDCANGLNIQIREENRIISGYVFEDTKTTSTPGEVNAGNGQYDTNESPIDDVIVQLIEIKEVTIGSTTLKLEYIWQETVSGSSVVKYVTNDGNAEGKYSVTNAKGQYTFNQNIIPGNYIVRFIYGDGTYYDTAIDGASTTDTQKSNILKYNGQNYKSTIDNGYDKTLYSADTDKYKINSNVARDNEARRLEEMGYATSITDVSGLDIDNKDKLNATWMCAETSKIPLEVESANVENINFGLITRPEVKLSLEKHIIGLNIDGITDTTTTFANYDNSTTGKVGFSYNSGEGVFATSSSKASRGFWLVETQADKIGGSNLEITYGYRVTNTSDADYIGSELKSELSKGISYSDIANIVKQKQSDTNEVYVPGIYLGKAYYCGQSENTDVATLISFQIEDYIGIKDGFKLDEARSNFKIVETNQAKDIWQYNTTNSSEKTAVEGTENVDIAQSREILTMKSNETKELTLTLTVVKDGLDGTATKKEFTYRSYAAQLIYPTNGKITTDTGSLCTGVTLGNLAKVQSYVDENLKPVSELVPEDDEFIAETVIITLDTGEDKVTSINLIITISLGLAVVAVGIVLIKKYVIK